MASETNCSNAQNNVFKRKIFVEPKDKKDLETVNGKYENALDESPTEGAVFMGVCRGKLSEGVDFADNRGRVVVITGIPYAPAFDPKVKLKKEYVQSLYEKKLSSISGNDWYQIQAVRAINQAVGRIIRHRNDFGAIIYLDSRFALSQQKSFMPSWVKSRLTISDNAQQVVGQLRGFFNKMAAYQRQGRLANPGPILSIQGYG